MIRPLARMLISPVEFNSCTDYQNAGIMWCATNLTLNGRYIPGYWGNCPETIPCNNEEGNSMTFVRVWYIPRYENAHLGIKVKSRLSCYCYDLL